MPKFTSMQSDALVRILRGLKSARAIMVPDTGSEFGAMEWMLDNGWVTRLARNEYQLTALGVDKWRAVRKALPVKSNPKSKTGPAAANWRPPGKLIHYCPTISPEGTSWATCGRLVPNAQAYDEDVPGRDFISCRPCAGLPKRRLLKRNPIAADEGKLLLRFLPEAPSIPDQTEQMALVPLFEKGLIEHAPGGYAQAVRLTPKGQRAQRELLADPHNRRLAEGYWRTLARQMLTKRLEESATTRGLVTKRAILKQSGGARQLATMKIKTPWDLLLKEARYDTKQQAMQIADDQPDDSGKLSPFGLAKRERQIVARALEGPLYTFTPQEEAIAEHLAIEGLVADMGYAEGFGAYSDYPIKEYAPTNRLRKVMGLPQLTREQQAAALLRRDTKLAQAFVEA